jgi:hypothetical protein
MSIIRRLLIVLVTVMAAFPAVGATPLAERAPTSFDSSPSLDDLGWKSIPRNGNDDDDASSTQPSQFYCITQATAPKTDVVVFDIVNSQLYYPGKMCIQLSFGYDCTPVVSGKDVSINLCGKKHQVPETQNAQIVFQDHRASKCHVCRSQTILLVLFGPMLVVASATERLDCG